MPSYRTAFGGSRYLKAVDLQGREWPVVIERVGLEQVLGEHGEEQKLVVRFAGAQKGLVLNRTNADGIAAIAGSDDYAQWPGTSLVLYVDPQVSFAGRTTGGIRVRATRAPTGLAFEQPRRPLAAVAAGGRREPFEYDSGPPRPREAAPALTDADIPF